MNDLSWMIYAAGVAGGLKDLTTMLAVGGGIGAAVSAIPFFISKSDGDESTAAACFEFGKAASVAFLVFGLAASVVPSKGTIYAIAASEMGEKALASPVATKAGKALEAWLDRQIDGDESAESDEE